MQEDNISRELGRIDQKVAELKDELKRSMQLIAEQMQKLTESTMQLGRVEVQQVQHSEGLARAFQKVEEIERHVNELDKTVSGWVNRGGGAWLIASAVLGIAFSIGIYLFDRAANELFAMRRELDGLKTVVEYMVKDDARKGGALLRQSMEGQPQGEIKPPVFYPPKDSSKPKPCAESGC